jgi:hypothetical protein
MKGNAMTDFATNLKRFVNATKNSMKYARICSEMALQHFHDTGNTAWCQEMFNAMLTDEKRANYVRQDAYVRWLVAHAPIKLSGRKMLKDKDKGANPFNLEAAFSKPFWDFAPAKENVNFSAEDVVTAMKNVVKRFQGERYEASNEAATIRLQQAQRVVEQLENLAVQQSNQHVAAA